MDQFSNGCKELKVKLFFKTEVDVLKMGLRYCSPLGKGMALLSDPNIPHLHLYMLLKTGSFSHEVSLKCVGQQQAAV